jgi:ribosomal-protein-alanine N-acetyltransferase
MTETVSRFCEYGFREVGLERIQAVVFEHNLPSARVLVKAGFRLEGLLRRYYEKDGWYLNGMLYSRLSGE